MTSPLIYNIGTVTLTNGSAEVTGDGTAWAINGVVGGVFSCGGMSVPIVSVDDDETLTLAYPWPGSNDSDVAYAISLIGSQAADTIWANRHWSRVVGQALLAAIRPDASGTLAERDALNPQLANGQWFARAEPPHDLEFYRKVPAGWEGPFTTRGVSGVGEGGLGLPSPGAADMMPWYSAPNTISLTALTAFTRSLLNLADSANWRAGIGANNAANLNTGTIPDARLPARLAPLSTTNTVTDANNAIENGVYWSPLGTPNNPEADRHYYIRVFKQNGDIAVKQVAYDASGIGRYERFIWYGSWYPWEKVSRLPGTIDINNWYQQFPSGAIVQSISFVATTNAGGGVYCVYPIAFPNYGRAVSVTTYDVASRFYIYSPETTNSQAALATDLGPSAGPYRFNVLAVGY